MKYQNLGDAYFDYTMKLYAVDIVLNAGQIIFMDKDLVCRAFGDTVELAKNRAGLIVESLNATIDKLELV